MTARNRYILTIDIEMTEPISNDAGSKRAEAAAELLAHDVYNFLHNSDWGYGRARVESVAAPRSQFAEGDFVPADAL